MAMWRMRHRERGGDRSVIEMRKKKNRHKRRHSKRDIYSHVRR